MRLFSNLCRLSPAFAILFLLDILATFFRFIVLNSWVRKPPALMSFMSSSMLASALNSHTTSRHRCCRLKASRNKPAKATMLVLVSCVYYPSKDNVHTHLLWGHKPFARRLTATCEKPVVRPNASLCHDQSPCHYAVAGLTTSWYNPIEMQLRSFLVRDVTPRAFSASVLGASGSRTSPTRTLCAPCVLLSLSFVSLSVSVSLSLSPCLCLFLSSLVLLPPSRYPNSQGGVCDCHGT